MIFSLEQNTFRNNNGVAVSVKRAKITDTNSKYLKNNSPSNGSCLNLASETSYTGSHIEFDQNESANKGGAVLVTTNSSFICTSCYFTTNNATDTGSKGGALYLESDSRTELSSCTFDGNKAAIGSAYFMTTSITDDSISSISNTTFTNNEV